MKILGRLIALSLFAVLIVLPATCCVNYTGSKPVIADGSPLPWPQPPQPPAAKSNDLLSADGSPLPWPQPPLPPLFA